MAKLADELNIFPIRQWLADDVLDRLAATFDAASGSTRDRIAAAISVELGDGLEDPGPLALPENWESQTVAELKRIAERSGSILILSNYRKDDVCAAIRAEVERRDRVREAVQLRDRYRQS